ncbi:MAG: hypothetical protein RLZZ165_1292, partial [Bacteroidota bacterium]
TNDYQKADVLMVSDFIMATLTRGMVQKIEEAKTQKTRFHSLTISNNPNVNVIQQFDHNWNYNTKGTNQNESLIKQLRSI